MNGSKDQPLLAIGDFAGFAEYVGKARRPKDENRRWRLMQVADRLFRSDVELLSRLQIEVYQPLMRSVVVVPRSKLSHSQRRNFVRPTREKIEPFFPGYIFLTFSENDQRWREVFKMVGISGLVCAGGRPVEVPLAMIDALRAREIDGAVPSKTRLAELKLVIGETVRVAEGPFASFSATVTELPKVLSAASLGDITLDQLDESMRVGLLVNIFGRQTPVSMSMSQIEKIA